MNVSSFAIEHKAKSDAEKKIGFQLSYRRLFFFSPFTLADISKAFSNSFIAHMKENQYLIYQVSREVASPILRNLSFSPKSFKIARPRGAGGMGNRLCAFSIKQTSEHIVVCYFS